MANSTIDSNTQKSIQNQLYRLHRQYANAIHESPQRNDARRAVKGKRLKPQDVEVSSGRQDYRFLAKITTPKI